MSESESECALCVPSFDAYGDLWTPLFCLMDRYWPDCTFPIYLGVNDRPFAHPRVRTLRAEPHDNWSDRLQENLSMIPQKYVLLMLDDWFLTKPVDNALVGHLLALMDRFDGHMLRLVPDPKPDHAVAGHPSIGLMGIGTLNRTNTHATIWRKDTLLSLLKAGESLWDFEVFGSVRSNCYSGGFFCVWRRALFYEGVISRGKWERSAARRYARMDIGCDFGARETKTLAEATKLGLVRTVHPLLRSILPMPFRQSVKRTVFGASAYPRDV